jgi:integrase
LGQRLKSACTHISVRTALLHKALKQAAADGLVPRNVVGMVKSPRSPAKEIQTLVPEQARALLQSAHTDRLEALFVLAVTTGMRQGELLGLKWEDVDMETGILQVRRTLSTATGSGFSFNAPKTAKGRRSIKLPASAISSLRRHRKAQQQESDKITGLWEDHGLVFTTHVGTPISRQDLIPAPSSRYCTGQNCRTYVSTTSGTRAPPYCSVGAYTPNSFRNFWATPQYQSRWTPTPTCCRA